MDEEDGLMVGGELVLYGPVGGNMMGDGFKAMHVARALAGLDGGPVIVHLNSGGGSAVDGEAIRALLSAYRGKVTVMVEGVAASAASLIAMAGDEIVMTPGSILMIHDPSAMTIGTSADHRANAETLDKLASTYAAVYAARSGKTTEEVRALMLAETWMTPDEAVEMGFADRVENTGEARAVAAFPFTVYANAPKELCAMADAKGWKQPDHRAVAHIPEPKLEANMADDPKAGAAPVAAENTPSPVAAPVMDADAVKLEAAKAVAAERARIRGINEAVMIARLDPSFADKLIADGVEMDAARERIIAEMAAKTENSPPRFTPRAVITRDEVQTRRDGIRAAMEAQITGEAPADVAKPYMQLRSIPAMAAALMGDNRPLDTFSNRLEVTMSAFHTTSDFPTLLENVLNKSLMARYRDATPTYRNLARRVSFADFRPHPMVKMGDFPEMQEIAENGEIKFGTFGEKKEAVMVKSYAIGARLSRQLIINDTLNGIQEVLADRGRAVARFEDKTFYATAFGGANNDGPTLLETSRQVFNTTDATKAGSGAAINVTSVNLGRAAMRKRTSIDGSLLDIEASIMLVGPDKELEAQQLLAPIQAQQTSNVNPFSGSMQLVVSPRIVGNAWYLFAAPANAPVFVYGYLDGFEAPRVRIDEPFGQQGVALTIEHDFGCGAIDFRGGYKNAGA